MRRNLEFWQRCESESLSRMVAHEENRQFVVQMMQTLTPDPLWTNRILRQVEAGYPETRCFVSWLAREIRPQSYLEVGVRRGFSMAMVASRSPEVEIYGFDLWLANYADVANPGPRFVQSELKKVGYRKRVHFFKGNSHTTLPAFFSNHKVNWLDYLGLSRARPTSFDLITIDGDHSLLGAYQDLVDVLPHCAVGGVVVFDDIAPDLALIDPVSLAAERGLDPHGWRDLVGVWHAIQKQFRNFRYLEYVENPPGVGLAIRIER